MTVGYDAYREVYGEYLKPYLSKMSEDEFKSLGEMKDVNFLGSQGNIRDVLMPRLRKLSPNHEILEWYSDVNIIEGIPSGLQLSLYEEALESEIERLRKE